ncbi:hypothetical protein MBLNU457_6155t1 [Dothideomycetes sp. NU457]
MPQKSILITGCSQHGIGAGLALEAASRGYTVFAGLRNPTKAPPELQQLSNVTLVSLDVTSSSSIAAAVQTITSATHDRGLDVLINNAGSGVVGPLADTEIEDAKALFETNFFGVLAVTKAFLPLLVKAKGVVLNNSSISGMLWMPWMGIYAATKAALSAYSETLRLELAPLHVRVITLQTGAVQSSFAANSLSHPLPADSAYKPIEGTIAQWASGEKHPAGQRQTVFCKTVLDHVERSGRGMVFEGVASWLAKYATAYLPRWVLDLVLRHGTGLDELRV